MVGLTSGENRPGDAGEFVGERDRQHVAVQPLRCLLDPGPQTLHCCARPPHQNDVCGLHEQCSQVFVATFGDLAQDRAIPRRLLLRHQPQPGAEITSLLEASAPLPMAATMALEIIGPTPGTVISRWQLLSCSASASISVYTVSMRSSSRRQSCIRSAMRLTILGESMLVFELRMSGSALRKGTTPCRTMMPRSIRKPRI